MDSASPRLNERPAIPIPAATPAEQAAIAALVQQILDAKAADLTADTRETEAAVDAAVAGLYGVALPAQ